MGGRAVIKTPPHYSLYKLSQIKYKDERLHDGAVHGNLRPRGAGTPAG
jgi:hypothetical protein